MWRGGERQESRLCSPASDEHWMKLQIAVSKISGACPGLFLPQLGQGLYMGQAGLRVPWGAPDMGCAGPCLPQGVKDVAPGLRIQRGKRDWGECQTPPEPGRNRSEQQPAWVPPAPQRMLCSKQHGHLLAPDIG